MSILAMASGASGMDAQQRNLDVCAHNLANANTGSFKSSQANFVDVMGQTLKSAGTDAGSGNNTPGGIQIGNGSRLISTTKSFSQGQLTQTDGKYDLAIEGDGFYEVERPDGTSGYTRDGALRVSSDGRIVTNHGYLLKGGFQAIPSGSEIVVAENGQVTVLAPSGKQSFRIQLVRFPNPGGLQSMGSNIYVETDASGAPELGNPGESGFGSIRQGFIEGSNVNAVKEMVDMITAQRAFEMSSKAIKAGDEMLGVVNRIKG